MGASTKKKQRYYCISCGWMGYKVKWPNDCPICGFTVIKDNGR